MNSSSACWKARASGKRSAGSRDSARITISSIRAGTAGLSVLGSGTSTALIRLSVLMSESVLNSRRPVSISWRMIPHAKMSDEGEMSSPDACSGDMYSNLPFNTPSLVL